MKADSASGELPEQAWTVALSSLDGMGPRRLQAILDRWAPREAWEAIRSGSSAVPRALAEIDSSRSPGPTRRWTQQAIATEVESVWETASAGGGRVCRPGDHDYPAALRHDPEPPAVLFHRGSMSDLPGPSVAIVGTRRCTRYGSTTAWELGRALAGSGVRVVSGLALGIDAAAHAGALSAASAPPVGVVATGLDVVYPRQNRQLWDEVARRGLVLTEAPPGTRPERWRFPSRNRIIAALARVVVVVESQPQGGSMYTVAEAITRDRTVMAVPGPIGVATSGGTNKLISEGAAPVLGVDDVLLALGLAADTSVEPGDPRVPPSARDQRVLDACGWEATTVDQLALRTGLGVAELLSSVGVLTAAGWIDDRGSGWIQRLARPAAESNHSQ